MSSNMRPLTTWNYKIILFQACICPKEWKYGLPAEICGKEIIAINKDHSCEPQFVYTCTELGGSRNSSPRNELWTFRAIFPWNHIACKVQNWSVLQKTTTRKRLHRWRRYRSRQAPNFRKTRARESSQSFAISSSSRKRIPSVSKKLPRPCMYLHHKIQTCDLSILFVF